MIIWSLGSQHIDIMQIWQVTYWLYVWLGNQHIDIMRRGQTGRKISAVGVGYPVPPVNSWFISVNKSSSFLSIIQCQYFSFSFLKRSFFKWFFWKFCKASSFTGTFVLIAVLFATKRYQVPRRGTVQLTLFNPQGTVVKMFVILFDLEEMPPNSKTFLRQRTYFMPAHLTDASPQAAKWLRYLIHLRWGVGFDFLKKIVDSLTHFPCWQMFRFCSSKTGRIYLHTDIRIIVLRKSDVDTASAHIATEGSYEWKSFTRGPSSPRFSTRWPTFFFFFAIIIAINFHGRRANCRFPNCPENRVLGIIYCLFMFSKRQT